MRDEGVYCHLLTAGSSKGICGKKPLQRLERKNKEKKKVKRSSNQPRLKNILLGKEVLKSAEHFLWDLISIEVNKFWSELKRMEAKKAYIYSALEKDKLATE